MLYSFLFYGDTIAFLDLLKIFKPLSLCRQNLFFKNVFFYCLQAMQMYTNMYPYLKH